MSRGRARWSWAVAALALAACGAPPLDVAVSFPRLGSNCDLGGVVARLSLPEQGLVCPLQAAGDRYEGSCVGVEPGDDVSLILEYAVMIKGNDLLLARAQRRVTIAVDAPLTLVTFEADELSYAFDDDQDGLQNIDELCLGRDLTQRDAPTFADSIVSAEPTSIGNPLRLLTIGERIKILGADFPVPELIEVLASPLLDGGKKTLPPTAATTAGAIEVQLPAGLDVSAKVTLAVDALGVEASRSLDVARAWAIAGATAPRIWLMLASGAYDASEPARTVELGAGCAPTLYDLSRDGRLLLFGCAPAAGAQLRVLDIPTGQLWAQSLAASATTTARLSLDGAQVVTLERDSGQLSISAIDRTGERFGPAQSITMPGAEALCFGAVGDDAIYLYFGGAQPRVGRVLLARGSGEVRLESALAGEHALDSGCLATPCDPQAGPVKLVAVGHQRVALVRPAESRVELVDLAAARVEARGVLGARHIALAPRTRDQLLVSAIESPGGRVGVCPLTAAPLEHLPCRFADGTAGERPAGLAVGPEQREVLVSASGGSKIHRFDLGSSAVTALQVDTGAVELGQVMIQP